VPAEQAETTTEKAKPDKCKATARIRSPGSAFSQCPTRGSVITREPVACVAL
jgi:hypothetical protein